MKVNSLFYTNLNENIIKCELCPHQCIIEKEKIGLCKTRKNIDGDLYTINYSDVTGFGLDPIEKKPLFHFHPGEEVLSLGTWGCNFDCPFCQNYEISQDIPDHFKRINPKTLPVFTEKYNVNGVAFTYSEPLVWYEFVLDACRELKLYDEDIFTILVTNGFINEKPFDLLSQYIDALNIDLKSFNDQKHIEVVKAPLNPVKETIIRALNKNIHLEITSLIVPEFNDSLQELEEEFKWLSNLSKDIPLHLSRYFPRRNYNKPPTDEGFLIEVYNIASKYLNYVYIGNMWNNKYESTYCPKCNNLTIERNSYDIKNHLNDNGGCGNCGKEIAKI